MKRLSRFRKFQKSCLLPKLLPNRSPRASAASYSKLKRCIDPRRGISLHRIGNMRIEVMGGGDRRMP
jgi:hypothetical protein